MEIMVGIAMVATAFGTGVLSNKSVFVFICRISSLFIYCHFFSHSHSHQNKECALAHSRAGRGRLQQISLCRCSFRLSCDIKIQALLPAFKKTNFYL